MWTSSELNSTNPNVIDAIFSQPVETLEKQQDSEEGHKTRTEIISEDREGQTGFCYCIPWSFYKMLEEQSMITTNKFWRSFVHL